MSETFLKTLAAGLVVLILCLLFNFNKTEAPEEKTEMAFENAISSLEDYDITLYATGHAHESLVYKILKRMPQMRSSYDVERYIRKKFPRSPLTGEMVTKYAVKHGVNVHLLLAIMQQDSGLGTTGKGARSRNPGNVGTWGGRIKTYPTWQKGVEAVAKWLKKHKKKKAGAQAYRPLSFLNCNFHKIFFSVFYYYRFFYFNIFFYYFFCFHIFYS